MGLVIRGLSKRYPNGIQALKDVSLTIPAGMFGLLGPNGAGKSTLMRTLATLQEADSGSASLDGLDVLRDKERVRSLLGYLPQEFGLYPKVTAYDMLDHFAALKGVGGGKTRRDVVTALLQKTNLFEARGQKLGTFSGGMKQRFGIAQALLGDPKLVIVDEPTAGLDPEERVRFHNLLADIGEDIVVILSTHIVSDVADLCPRMAIIDKGEVILEGEPLALCAEAKGRIFRRFVAREEVERIRSEHQVISTRRVAGRIAVHVHAEARPDPSFEAAPPDLEDVYFLAIKRHHPANDGDSDGGCRRRRGRVRRTMLFTIARFEALRRLRQLSTKVYFAVYFLCGMLFLMASAGAFKGVNMGIVAGGKTLVNSPVALYTFTTLLSYFGLQTTAAVMGQAVYQDFESGAAPLFFTLPVKKWQYLGGRFLGALAALVVIYASIGLGCFAGTLMPGVEKSLIGPNRLVPYLWPYVVAVLPNLLFTGAIFFSMAALTRNIRAVYVSSVLLLVGYLIASSLFDKIEDRSLAGLLDPLGLNAGLYTVEYWTVAERNTRLIPLAGVLLGNRLLWLAAGAAAFAVTLRRFRFSHGNEGRRQAGGAQASPEPVPVAETSAPLSARVAVTRRHPLSLLPGLTRLALRETVKNGQFLVLVLAGVLTMILASRSMGALFGTPTHAVTYAVLEITTGGFTLFLIAITTYYAGELVWRERDARMSQIADALPVPTWLPFLSKLGALCLVQALLMVVVMVTSLGIQVAHGHFHFEIGLYLVDLFANRLPRLCLVCVLAITIQAVVDNKYVGYFVMGGSYAGVAFLPRFGLDHHLYLYGTVPRHVYSDMNGYGHFVRPIVWFDVYWAAAAVLLAVVSNLFWVRGLEHGFRGRLRLARARFTPGLLATAAAAGLVFVGAGGFIFYNTNVLNHYRTSYQGEEIQAEAERRFKARESDPTPRIVDVTVACDLYPEERRVEARGHYVLRNKTLEPIARVLVALDDQATLHKLSLGGVDRPSRSDARHGYHDFDLPVPLAPGAETTLDFELTFQVKGFPNEEKSSNRLAENGTFFDSSWFPHLGYQRGAELADDDVRRKHGLAPRPRMADLEDRAACRDNYATSDTDWMGLDATLSTSPDQIAVAPGDLVRAWEEGGRRHYHYRMARPILGFFSIVSARYAVKHAAWHDVGIEIYYHPDHAYNVDRMIASIQASLDYFTASFSPYQHQVVRIVEFPRYQSFAQSFPNTIPYSERVGFIAKVDPKDESDLDYPYYVTAHEVAHQWWAHQVIGGDVQGATMLSETLAQYSALMVMKARYGEAKMKRFLRYELDRYLVGRSFEKKKELPLERVENQPYIHYQKGSLAMYRLADQIGEPAVNRALAAFVARYAYCEPPYPNAADLVGYLREATPPEQRALIEDLFETITLYDDRALSATYVEKGENTYEVKLHVTAKKLRADELGAEKEVPLDDRIDIGVLGADGTPLWMEKRRFTRAEEDITVTVTGKPAKAGIDPLNKLVDRDGEDNVVTVKKE